ncbi:MAG: hypothetical protein C4318_02185 [Acidimicrobiia bacterium]
MAVAWKEERKFIAGKSLCDDGAGGLTDLFFSEEIPDIIQAKAICRMCENREPCLEGALARREPWGVWGGELFMNGKIVPKKRPRGRPPKDPAKRISA